MLKKIFSIIKKIIMAICLICSYNMLVAPLGYIIPINFTTIILVSVLGIPMLLSLILLMILFF